jgi:hypothetical protein
MTASALKMEAACSSEIFVTINFRFSPCIIIVSHFYCPTNVLNYIIVRYSRLYRTHTPQVQNYTATHRPSTRHICEPLRGISVKHSSVFPDDGSHKIQNISEWFLVLCLLNFYTTWILTSKFCIIECISGLIKVICDCLVRPTCHHSAERSNPTVRHLRMSVLLFYQIIRQKLLRYGKQKFKIVQPYYTALSELGAHRFPCGRWLGRGIDDDSTERLLVGELVPHNVDSEELMETCRTPPPRCHSPSVPRRSQDTRLSVAEIQHMLGEATTIIGICVPQMQGSFRCDMVFLSRNFDTPF